MVWQAVGSDITVGGKSGGLMACDVKETKTAPGHENEIKMKTAAETTDGTTGTWPCAVFLTIYILPHV